MERHVRLAGNNLGRSDRAHLRRRSARLVTSVALIAFAMGSTLLIGCGRGARKHSSAGPQEEDDRRTATVEVLVFKDRATETYGLVLSDGRILIPPTYPYADSFSEGLAMIETGDSGAFIDIHGRVAARILVATTGSRLCDGRVSAADGSGQGYMNRNGVMVIAPVYDFAGKFSEGMAIVGVGEPPDEEYGYVDRSGRLVVDPQYNKVGPFSHGLARVRKGLQWGYIDRTGREVIPLQYIAAEDFVDGFAMICKDGKYGFLDLTGRLVVPLDYDDAMWAFFEGMGAVARDGEGWGFVDATGREAIPCQFRYVHHFRGGLASVHVASNDRWGIIDKTGQMVIEPRFDLAEQFYHGRAAVNIGGRHSDLRPGVVHGGKWGFIDRSGELVIPAIYDDVTEFYGRGVAYVKQGDESFLIDTNGRPVSRSSYSIRPNYDDSAVVPAEVFDYLPEDCPRLDPPPEDLLTMVERAP